MYCITYADVNMTRTIIDFPDGSCLTVSDIRNGSAKAESANRGQEPTVASQGRVFPGDVQGE